jgi:cytochrome P450
MAISSPEIPYFDFNDPAFAVVSDAVREAREVSWYARTNVGLAVLRHEEVGTLLKDRRLRQGSFAWPSQNGIADGVLTEWWADILLSKEGEDHRRLRKLVNPAFSPRLIESMVPRFQALADELIDGFIDRGECEFITEFAEPYAARVLTQLFGIPDDQWHQLMSWATDIILGFTVTIAQDLETIEKALKELYVWAEELIEERRDNLGDDIMSKLIAAHTIEGELSRRELLSTLALLLVAGMDTTRNQLGLAVQLFAQHPDQWALLAERPELGGSAIEELVRFNPTVTWITRQATEDIEMQGVQIPAGTTIHLLSPPANTDPRAIGGDPVFDITAARPPHFGFGGGAHHCLGHFLARIDMREALPLLARRLQNPRITEPPRLRPSSGVTGAIELRIAFTPGP